MVLLAAATQLVIPAAHAIENGGAGGGTTSGKVPTIDGQPANSTRWLVSVYDGTYACSGAVVLDEWVLTARHCVDRHVENGGAAPDSMRLDTVHAEGDHVVAAIERVFYPEVGDIALLHLAEPYLHAKNKAGQSVRPLGPPLGMTPVEKQGPAVGYGFGMERVDATSLPETVKAAGLRVTAQTTLLDNRGRAWAAEPDDVKIDHGTWSVSYPAGVPLDGDSGGPLVMDGMIIGVLSGTGLDSGDAYYVQIHAQVDWIYTVLNL